MRNYPEFPYEPELCPGRVYVNIVERIIGCSLCGIEVNNSDILRTNALIVAKTKRLIRCTAVANAYQDKSNLKKASPVNAISL